MPPDEARETTAAAPQKSLKNPMQMDSSRIRMSSLDESDNEHSLYSITGCLLLI